MVNSTDDERYLHVLISIFFGFRSIGVVAYVM